ncbi:ATP-dependent RNA helicase DbpA [Sulfuricurvum sp. IAE1]|mgnify:CR=1 FL=1|uniref:ATP-dependent RNA helicase DbpA n=1 Tax=Sulfuricurvum sp. IAE1 TaxID=2546102 RepID=UPI001046E4F4|nr:ATP-dependent RNA helicase DbpA [Sulfuricurvum sp. IAE1]TDA64118.1 ATP-dependent RNA helicase DbpA [Sulfuricurvum sp. IAE1]
MSPFDSLPLRPQLFKALSRLGFTTMTQIQSDALPSILAGKNVIARSATGSGKTLAFSLGVLEKIDPKRFEVQALLLCPTRELAEQVAKTIRSLASEIGNVKVLSLCGGVPMRGQIHSLKHGAHIIVGTPGRVLKLLQIDALSLSAVNTAVLDEADHMIDMGFIEDISAILEYVQRDAQHLLFSATYPETILSLASTIIKDPVFIHSENPVQLPGIDEIAYRCTGDRPSAVASIMAAHDLSGVMIFCNTKIQTDELCNALNKTGIHALALHGDMEQFDRNEAIIQFRNGSVTALVATDVAGRGIDIDGLDAIINYDVPTQKERYVHRIGRTGRAGKSGLAITLCDDETLLRAIGIDLPLQPLGDAAQQPLPRTSMQTLCIDAGRKEKLRAGDIVGALIHECALTKEQIGKIDQLDHLSYVALPRSLGEKIYQKLKNRPIKGRNFRLWLLD